MAPTRAGTMHHVKPQFNGRDDDVYKNCDHVKDGHENNLNIQQIKLRKGKIEIRSKVEKAK